MRIAIVDDDPIVCQSLETILTATDTADVLWSANDGGAAIRRYFESPENLRISCSSTYRCPA